MVEPGAGGGGARRPMIVREPPPAGVNAFAEVGRGLNLAREKLAQQMNRRVLGVVVGDFVFGAAGGAAAKIALDLALGITGGPLGGAASGALKGGIGEWLKQSREIAASGDRLSFKENLKRHNGGRIALAAGRGAIIGAVGGAVGAYVMEEISQTEWGQQAGKFIGDRAGEFARTISKQPFFTGAPSSAPDLLEPGQIPSLPAIPDTIEPLPSVPAPAEPPPAAIPLPTAPAVPVEIPPAAPAPEVDTPLPPSPTAPGEVLLPPPAIVEPPPSVAAPPEFKPQDIQTDQVADQVEPLPPTEPVTLTPTPEAVTPPEPATVTLDSLPQTIYLESGSNPWATTSEYLKQALGREPTNAEISEATKALCRASDINVPEWGIPGGFSHTRLPIGFQLKFDDSVKEVIGKIANK